MYRDLLIENEDVDMSRKNVYISDLNVYILKKKVNISTQKKKEKEKKKGEGDCVAHTPEEIEAFKAFEKWLQTNTPNVCKMKEPFTIDEYLVIKKEFDGKLFSNYLKSMHNYKPLLQKNISANLTFRNWVKRDSGKEPTEITGPDNYNQQLLETKKRLLNERKGLQQSTA